MRRLTCPFLGALLAAVAPWGGARAQQVRSASELALDSLLDMPVSTAAKYDQRQADAPAFVTIVTHDEIHRFGYRTLEEVLQNQTGFYSGNDREYSDVGARGVGRPGQYNNKILLLVDGHSLNDGFSGGARLGSDGSIDLEAVERVEIIRGPGSALYGARAMLAVVNLVTRKGRELDGLEVSGDVGVPQRTDAALRFGKVIGNAADLFVSTSWSSSDGEDIYFPEMDDPALNHGVAKDLDWERRFRGLTTLRSGGWSAQAMLSDRKKGIPTGAYRTVFNHPDAMSHDRAAFLEVGHTRDLGSAAEMSVRAFGESYLNEGLYPFSQPGTPPTAAASDVWSHLTVESVGGEARVRWDAATSLRLVGGVEAQRFFRLRYTITHGPEDGAVGGVPYSVLSGFTHAEYQVTPRLSVTLGLRRDEYSTRGSATTPRGALVYHPARNSTLKVMVGDAFRAPNGLELYVNHLSAGILANRSLAPEKVRTYEMVWEQGVGPLAVTVAMFRNDFRDLIELATVELPDSLALWGNLAFEQQNVARVRATGMDAQVRAALPGEVLGTVGFSATRAVDRATKDPIVNSPSRLLRIGASREWAGWGVVCANVRMESGRRTLYGTETGDVAVVDAAVTSRTFMDHLELQVTGRNLLDSDYSVPGGFQHVQAAIPQPRRSVVFRANLTW